MGRIVALTILILAFAEGGFTQRTNASDCGFYYNDSCKVLAHQPFPSNFVCSQQGVLPHPDDNLVPGTPCGTYDVFQSDYNQFGHGNSCGIGCMNNPKCIVWSWDFYNSECRWYTKNLPQMAFNATPNGPYTIRYFNRHCLYKDCTHPNLIYDGSFEKTLPVPDDGSKKPDTWFSDDTGDNPPANCSFTSQSFIGAHGYKCHQSPNNHAIIQYPSAILPNTTYSISLLFGFVPGNFVYEGDPSQFEFYCRLYGDGVKLASFKFCQLDYEGGVCSIGDGKFYGYSSYLNKARWKSGPGPRGSHSVAFNCSAGDSWDTWVDDFEVRAL